MRVIVDRSADARDEIVTHSSEKGQPLGREWSVLREVVERAGVVVIERGGVRVREEKTSDIYKCIEIYNRNRCR